jgi:hypothetical protein
MKSAFKNYLNKSGHSDSVKASADDFAEAFFIALVFTNITSLWDELKMGGIFSTYILSLRDSSCLKKDNKKNNN